MRDGPSTFSPPPAAGGHAPGPKPSCRFGYVSAVVSSGYWLLGGYDGDRWLNDLWRYDLSGSPSLVRVDPGNGEI